MTTPPLISIIPIIRKLPLQSGEVEVECPPSGGRCLVNVEFMDQLVHRASGTKIDVKDHTIFRITHLGRRSIDAESKEAREQLLSEALYVINQVSPAPVERLDVRLHIIEQDGVVLSARAVVIRSAPGIRAGDIRPALDESSLLLQAIVTPSHETAEGVVICGVAIAWFEIVKLIKRDPEIIYRLHWRQWEEILAGAYEREGWEVTLTPRSGDRGRDVIATRNDIGSIRLLDQMKAFKAGNPVSADDVRAMMGVLGLDQKASKAVVTTTSVFAPEVYSEFASVMPSRLDLRPREKLLPWLEKLAEQ